MLCEETNETLSILMEKWKIVILFHLLYGGTKRFGELKRLIQGITQKILTNQLRELEDQDIIGRKVYPEVPPRVEYSITEYGKSLQPILEELYKWGDAHLNHRENKKRNQSID
ncbi:winged helix-turn-helix transcriptional regulator [Metabacillus arenae]|nr:winged helix-turn-helix transcriptional regulator [Metabacillus arenae]